MLVALRRAKVRGRNASSFNNLKRVGFPLLATWQQSCLREAAAVLTLRLCAESAVARYRSILEVVEHIRARHHDGEGAKVALDSERAGMVRKHIRQAAIDLWCLIEAAPHEAHALAAQPRLHLVVTHQALLTHALAGGGIAHGTSARCRARHHAPSAVHGGIEARRRGRALHARDD